MVEAAAGAAEGGNINRISIEKITRTLILIVLVAQTAFIVVHVNRSQTQAATVVKVDPGKNYSLLIDDERLPIAAKPGEEIRISVERGGEKVPPLPRRIVINQVANQDKMSTVTQPRFRFYYNTPAELRELYVNEKLSSLRGSSDWNTIIATVARVRSVLRAGDPKVYPTENAAELLKSMRKEKQQVFCAQYCYLTVQFLQAQGFYARYLTILGHEVSEVWVPQFHKWVCLDATNGVYYEDLKGKKLSAYEVSQPKNLAQAKKFAGGGLADVPTAPYRKIWFWLCNDLVTRPVNIYDLNKYRVRIIENKKDLEELSFGDLYTLYPEELYASPETGFGVSPKEFLKINS